MFVKSIAYSNSLSSPLLEGAASAAGLSSTAATYVCIDGRLTIVAPVRRLSRPAKPDLPVRAGTGDRIEGARWLHRQVGTLAFRAPENAILYFFRWLKWARISQGQYVDRQRSSDGGRRSATLVHVNTHVTAQSSSLSLEHRGRTCALCMGFCVLHQWRNA